MTTYQSLDAIESRLKEIVEPFDVHLGYKRFATSPTHDGGPHIEKMGEKFAWVMTERGLQLERRETTDSKDILYWLVSSVTVQVAQKYELENRQEGTDSRRVWFELNVELLTQIDPDWGARKRKEYDQVLTEHPYSD